ncbi:MAG TPA: sigma-70 family RNA polymerase sigma factor [Planctomycetota bacterium]|nr:sigma-70 family RNA polymerase sigma factor [Planctomycetota bacterium]
MNHDTEILGDCRGFDTTRWNLVRVARDREALDSLIQVYWKPLYFFVRRKGYDNETSKDVIQDFLASLIERDGFVRADPGRGKFRSYLLAGLTNHLKDWTKSANRKKRLPPRGTLSLDFVWGEREYSQVDHTTLSPEAVLDRAWARSLLEQSIAKLEGSAAHREAFRLWFDDADFRTISDRTGLSEGAAKSAVHRLRGELRKIVTGHLRRFAADEDELRAELSDFVSLFA